MRTNEVNRLIINEIPRLVNEILRFTHRCVCASVCKTWTNFWKMLHLISTCCVSCAPPYYDIDGFCKQLHSIIRPVTSVTSVTGVSGYVSQDVGCKIERCINWNQLWCMMITLHQIARACTVISQVEVCKHIAGAERCAITRAARARGNIGSHTIQGNTC